MTGSRAYFNQEKYLNLSSLKIQFKSIDGMPVNKLLTQAFAWFGYSSNVKPR